ncbi:hypothetical protein SAMN05216271_0744 [Halopseudomonas sabulinigri]|uniref:Uncharacterized protein n=1 Tax=Halopseudomonas sabulinigri TaxID=472181 RepID=A0A1H1N094_9GAMM|nr:hypothetical protein [Halopseudomonas sabulinigri]SDR92372.1 hypothetical protein SAMN05216271_0744 [Halopseudomonas sabulinigri]
MKYYKFWVKESVKINVGQSAEFVSILSGSNTSIEDARLELAKQSRFVEQKINGEGAMSYFSNLKCSVRLIYTDECKVSPYYPSLFGES